MSARRRLFPFCWLALRGYWSYWSHYSRPFEFTEWDAWRAARRSEGRATIETGQRHLARRYRLQARRDRAQVRRQKRRAALHALSRRGRS